MEPISAEEAFEAWVKLQKQIEALRSTLRELACRLCR
jgi:hypothetical protein